MDATDCGLYDGVGAALLTYDAADPAGVYRCFGACMESQTEDCGGVSLRVSGMPLACPTGVHERSSAKTVLARESGRGGDVFLGGAGLAYEGKLVTLGSVCAFALLSSASKRVNCTSKLDT